jgi:hypothetical protein
MKKKSVAKRLKALQGVPTFQMSPTSRKQLDLIVGHPGWFKVPTYHVGVYDPETGEVLFSWHRHDYQENKNGIMIDGGFDYVRYSLGQHGLGQLVQVNLTTGEITFESESV